MKELSIIQQNDTHGAIESHEEFFWNGNSPSLSTVGGLARISQYVKQLKSSGKHVLFFDGGDLFHGTAPLVSSQGTALLEVLNEMPLDAWVPGNWDFAYGKGALTHLAASVSFETLACNITDTETGASLFKPYMIKEINGLKIGVIGLTYPYVDLTMPASFSEGLAFSLGIEEVKQAVANLQGTVDLIMLNSHMGLPLDIQLVKDVSGIDLILSGHSHDRVRKPLKVNDTLIFQSGSSSSFVGRIDLKISGGKIKDYSHKLITLNTSFVEDPIVLEKVNALLLPFEEMRRTQVGVSHSLLHRMTLQEAPMDQLITDAYLTHFGADLSFSHGWRYGTPISPGTLSLYDLHTIIPTNPKLFEIELSGQMLRKVLEKNLQQVFAANPYEQKGGYILRSSGLDLIFKPYNPEGERIQELFVKGKEVSATNTVKVIGGGEQLFKNLESQKHYHNIQAIDVIQEFLERQPFETDHQSHIISV